MFRQLIPARIRVCHRSSKSVLFCKDAAGPQVPQDIVAGKIAPRRNLDGPRRRDVAVAAAVPLAGRHRHIHGGIVRIDDDQAGLEIGVGGRLQQRVTAALADTHALKILLRSTEIAGGARVRVLVSLTHHIETPVLGGAASGSWVGCGSRRTNPGGRP